MMRYLVVAAVMGKRWFPLESNPGVMNTYIKSLGVEMGVAFTDVFGTDPGLLAMVPGPVRAVVFLFPITAANDAAQASLTPAPESGVVFMKQTVDNACGTVGILHALGNNHEHFSATAGSFVQRFVEKAAGATPDTLAEFVEADPELDTVQATAAQSGQTSNQDLDASINLHFICYVERNGTLFELDGRRPAPMAVGPCPEGGVLAGAAQRAEVYMKLNPSENNFSLVALTSGAEE